MTDFSTMTNDQLDEYLAVKVMGWTLDLIENEWGLRYYRDADGKSVMDARLWQPTRDLNQAVKCADYVANLGFCWTVENVENDHYHACVLRPSDYWIATNKTLFDCDTASTPTRALCEALAMAVEGEG